MELRTGYKQTEVGVIPSDWEVKKLGELGKFSKGSGVRKDESLSGDIPCVRYGELYTRHSNYIKQFYSYISKEVSETAKKLKTGDILFAGSGETKEEIGKSVAFIDEFDAYAGGDIVILTPTNVEPLYLGYLLNAPIIQKQKASRGQGDAVVHISAAQLAIISIALPANKAEQTAIATALSDTDQYITHLEKLIAKKRNIKQGAMQELLKPKEGWVVTKFKDKDVTELITCGIAATPIYVDENIGVPFLSSTNVKNGKIQWNNFKYISKELHHQLYRNNPPVKGDILYSRVGTIGEAAIIDVEFEFSVYVSLTLIKTGKLLDAEFLKQLLNSKKYKDLANNTVLMGGGVGNLNVNVVREFPIPIPSREEQTRISTILSEMDSEITTLETKLSKAKSIKQGMMQQLLTGKIRLI